MFGCAPIVPEFLRVVPSEVEFDGEPALSAECYQPDHIGNQDQNYEPVIELLTGEGQPQDHSEILSSIETTCYVKSILAAGLIEADEDGDRVPYRRDNCTIVANADQRDTNKDGFGNACYADLDNSGAVNFADVAAFRADFGMSDPESAKSDLDGSGGAVNFGDLARFRSMFGKPVGPSGTAPWGKAAPRTVPSRGSGRRAASSIAI